MNGPIHLIIYEQPCLNSFSGADAFSMLVGGHCVMMFGAVDNELFVLWLSSLVGTLVVSHEHITSEGF
jgi:hypothetical protein